MWPRAQICPQAARFYSGRMDVLVAPPPQDTLHAEMTDALSRGLVTPAEVAGLSEGELGALVALCRDALAVGEAAKALTLSRALVVLSPYWGMAWRLLAQALEAAGETTLATTALSAVALLAPPEPEPEPAAAAPSPAPAPLAPPPALEATVTRTLTLRDGRPLPLRHTPAARHHDTVTARLLSQALLTDSSRAATARWAQATIETELAELGTDTAAQPAVDPLRVTGTAIVRRRPAAEAQAPAEKRDAAADPLDATGKIRRPIPARAALRAAARRRMGWPVTDSWVSDEPTVTAVIPPGGATRSGGTP